MSEPARKTLRPRHVCLLVAVLAGCSGSTSEGDFVVDEDSGTTGDGATADGGTDSGGGGDTAVGSDTGGGADSSTPGDGSTTDSGAPGDTGGPTDSGAPVDTGIAADTGTPVDTGADTGVVCGTLPADWTDAYVDKSSTLPSVGTKACPFRTILEATSLSIPTAKVRRIYVKGGTSGAPFVYAETKPLEVKPGVILQGEGPLTTKITEGDAGCPKSPGGSGGFHCAVFVQSGGTVQSFTITSAAGVGVVTDTAGVAGSVPVVRVVDATGSKQDGVMTLGAAQVGPLIHANGNGRHGLNLIGAFGNVTVPGGDGSNSFDGNTGDGVHLEGGGLTLTFSQGTASSNGQNGVLLQSGGSSGVVGKHSIDKLTAKTNKASGLVVGRFTSIALRNSTLLQNGNHGLWFSQGATNGIDLGGPTAGSAVVFSGATSGNRNGKSGFCIDNSGATGSIVAAGDSWGTCAPPQTAVTQCSAVSTYGEINYAAAAVGGGANPVAVSGCIVGP